MKSNALSLAAASVAAVLTMTANPAASQAQDATGNANNPTFGNRTQKPDGTVALTVGRRLPTEWETRLGLDASLAPEPASDGAVLRGSDAKRSTGAVWGSMTGPSLAPVIYDKTTIEARLDPTEEHGKVEATLSRKVPLGNGLFVTLRDQYAVTRSLNGGPATTDTSNAGTGAGWSIDRSVRLSLGSTGTTLSAGTATSSGDSQWHNKLSAEQNLIGPLNVTTSVTDPGTAASSKSITAGFKHTW